ncbi:serine/threonine-protein kinase [Streptomyces sp. 4N509B]|uniref:serine/threonine-protein kinase n=1 Tax=Streptomyces sp. 4N509B TaxID=3457413 RepID=UPI003FD4859D
MHTSGGDESETTSYGLRPPDPAAVSAAPPRPEARTAQLATPPAPPTPPTPQRGSAAPAPGAEPTGSRDGGRLLGGRYRLVERLGHGGMGTVWRARDEVVDRDVAVKEPRLPRSVGEEHRANLHARMRREARAAARVTHPSVVAVHDVVVEDDQPWLVMELVRGESLADVLETGTLEPREAARVGLAVLEALVAAHEAGVLHRDVKPANVLLGRGGRVVLTDFGIAHVEGDQQLTSTGVFVGSPEYAAPERIAGHRPGPESDLWSLGVMLYAAVEGVSPFRRSNQAATVQAVTSAEPQAPVRAGEPLAGLVLRLLAKQPAARPGAEEIRRVLSAVAAPPPDATLGATRLAPGVPGAPPLPGAVAGTAPGAVPGAGEGGRRGRGRALLAGFAAGAVLATGVLLAPFSPTSPFGGEEESTAFTEEWRTHQEDELRFTLEVPRSFERSTDPEDPSRVNYTSRDGIFQVSVWSWDDEEGRSPLNIANDVLEEYHDSFSYDDVDGDFGETVFQEREGAELWLEARDAYASEGEDHLRRALALFHAEEGTDHRWRVQVGMPGESGHSRAYGEQLYADVVESLVIDDGEAAG